VELSRLSMAEYGGRPNLNHINMPLRLIALP